LGKGTARAQSYLYPHVYLYPAVEKEPCSLAVPVLYVSFPHMELPCFATR
jgi:hypothetical protein